MELKTIKDCKTINDVEKAMMEYIKEFQRQRKEERDWGMIDLKIGKRTTSVGCRSGDCSGIQDFINHFLTIEEYTGKVKVKK